MQISVAQLRVLPLSEIAPTPVGGGNPLLGGEPSNGFPTQECEVNVGEKTFHSFYSLEQKKRIRRPIRNMLKSKEPFTFHGGCRN